MFSHRSASMLLAKAFSLIFICIHSFGDLISCLYISLVAEMMLTKQSLFSPVSHDDGLPVHLALVKGIVSTRQHGI